jgi:hypothetical protein
MMSDNWAQSDATAMRNPLGGIKRGWAEIRSVYERVFTGPAEVRGEYFDYTIHETREMFYTVGRERGYCRLEDEKIALAIRTSRIFKKSVIAGNKSSTMAQSMTPCYCPSINPLF